VQRFICPRAPSILLTIFTRAYSYAPRKQIARFLNARLRKRDETNDPCSLINIAETSERGEKMQTMDNVCHMDIHVCRSRAARSGIFGINRAEIHRYEISSCMRFRRDRRIVYLVSDAERETRGMKQQFLRQVLETRMRVFVVSWASVSIGGIRRNTGNTPDRHNLPCFPSAHVRARARARAHMCG